ncbi:branched-chain amino acid ABC transporter substrate-binding protein, partial [Variovorax sp. J22R24]|nr:branched-chain amino acid ABC transporter substrate-binding protein [Variovorax sp. J22R24]
MNPSFICRRAALKFGVSALCASAFGLAQAQSAPPIRIALVESMSGPFANTGEAVFRNILWAVERVNARGGVKLP